MASRPDVMYPYLCLKDPQQPSVMSHNLDVSHYEHLISDDQQQLSMVLDDQENADPTFAA